MKRSWIDIFEVAFLFVVSSLLIGYGVMDLKKPEPEPEPEMNYSIDSVYDTIELDGCEYFIGYRKMAHKGNCRNPIHNPIKE